MQAIFNQFSYIFFSIAAAIAVGVVARVILHWSLRVTSATAVSIAVIAVAGWFFVRPGPTNVSDLDQAEATLRGGKPTLLEFYSNYCVGCIAARTAFEDVVTQMTEQFDGQFNVLRVDIHTDSGRALREEYGFSFTPEFVVFDGQAAELWRSHAPPTLSQLAPLVAPDSVSNTSG